VSRTVQPRTIEGRLADLENRIAEIERRHPAAIGFSDGNIARARVGKHGDGKFGLRAWNAAGTLVVDQTA
jgi:hypothetical protein